MFWTIMLIILMAILVIPIIVAYAITVKEHELDKLDKEDIELIRRLKNNG